MRRGRGGENLEGWCVIWGDEKQGRGCDNGEGVLDG